MTPEEAANIPSNQKPILRTLARDSSTTKEGKYLVMRRDGTIPGWPSFVLGAADPHAPAALRAYANSIAANPDCHPDLPVRLLKLADEFDEWRKANGEGDPTRGLHRVDNPLVILLMQQGQSA